MSRLDFRVNGRSYTVDAEPDTPLLYILRNDLQINGPKFGCGLAQCGACTVIVRGAAVRACVLPAGSVQGVEVTTLEGLGTVDNPHPIQQAFIDEQAAQCGYCINGMIMTAKAYVDHDPAATDAEIRQALAGNLCRCGTHLGILRAVRLYTEEVRA